MWIFLLLFQSTPPARGATATVRRLVQIIRISIHAPREGGDVVRIAVLTTNTYFNPRPPRGGRRRICTLLSCRLHFNPRPPRGGRLDYWIAWYTLPRISIHAPREGGDSLPSGTRKRSSYFNPRPPRGGRLAVMDCRETATSRISIHAPREGGDARLPALLSPR